MHWIPFAIATFIVVLFQTTVGGVLTLTRTGIGTIGPDFAAILAVYIALHGRKAADVMIAAWILGFAMDLTASGAALGVMALAYSLAAGGIFRIREAFFQERALTQALLVLAFCAATHGVWVTAQYARVRELMAVSDYVRLLLQAGSLAVYTGLLTPLVNLILQYCRGWLLPTPTGRSRR
jgi:rod shape-determining protein MreD